MRVIWAAALCFMVGLSSQAARADAVAVSELAAGQTTLTVLQPGVWGTTSFDDPQVVVHQLKRGSLPFSGFSFSFLAPDGSGDFNFFNANPVALLELTLTITPGGQVEDLPAIFACGASSEFDFLPFSNCSFVQIGDAGSATIVSYLGGPGLPAGSHFAIDLTGYQPNTFVTVTAVPASIPEPGTILLLVTGVGTLLARRRLR